jgi:hypothetical protein
MYTYMYIYICPTESTEAASHKYICICICTYTYIYKVLKTLRGLEKNLEAFEVERLLSGKFDKFGCTLCIQSGAGGTEAMDWAGMLFRMYKRFAERRGFKTTIMEEVSLNCILNCLLIFSSFLYHSSRLNSH